MAYLIKSPQENYQRFLISEIDFQTGGSIFIIPLIEAGTFICLTRAYLFTENQTVDYVGFTQLTLGQSGGSPQGYILESSLSPGGINTNEVYAFAVNTGPSNFGTFIQGPRFFIDIATPPTAGNGNIILDLFYYTINK